jgi:hypothetical protein
MFLKKFSRYCPAKIFKNKISPKRAREKDAPIGGAPGRRDVYFS